VGLAAGEAAGEVKVAADLTTRVGAVELANPVVAASGTCGTGVELARAADVSRLGAVVLKTVTYRPREGNRPPRIAETPSGMLNSIGLENPGVERFVERFLPKARELGVPLVGSVAGEDAEDYARTARLLSEAGGLVAVEANLSCPNVHRGGEGAMRVLAFGQEPGAAAEVVRAVAEAVELPVWAKLTASVADIVEMGRACAEAGADALVAVNTLPGMAVDVRARRPVLGCVTGGLSGPAIMPVSLRCVWELARALDAPLVASGGALTAEDVAAFLLVGASAVEVGTASFRDPAAAVKIVDSLGPLLDELGVGSARSLVGKLEDAAKPEDRG
jgi:dihydroorotate dehydrogenase (NAD+) catalytic subunit